MADSKISALTSGNPAQSGDEIPIARGGANYKITAGSIASLSGNGDVVGPASSTDSQIALFNSTTGKLIKAATTTGVLKASSGVIAAATSGTDYLAPPSGTAILKANSGGALANATAGTDYAPATTGTNTQLLANSGSGGFANVTVGSGLTLAAGTLSASGGGGSPGGSSTQVQYNNSGSFGGITNATTDGTTLSMTSPKVITSINDTNGNELLKVTATTSAVNELTLANAATGVNPVLSATGGDTNIGITLTPKGTGGVVFPAGAVSTPAITTTGDTNTGVFFPAADTLAITTGGSERSRFTSDGAFLVGTTTTAEAGTPLTSAGFSLKAGYISSTTSLSRIMECNRLGDDGVLIAFWQASSEEGTISVSGNTVSYNGFSGGHWSQLQQGRGYNPDIPRGTVMSSIGEMAEWKSVVWDEIVEHPAAEAVASVEGKDAWTETINKREAYFGNLAVGATFTEDGFTKTVVDDGNERLPKVKISDVVGDKAVYGVFQTYDEVQDMLITSLGAFVVRVASEVTVQIGDLLESNGDGCAKVQDDDVIRSKTIGKVTSTVKIATYADGSYTVPCVLYCG